MLKHQIIVIGCSAGGLTPLKNILSLLPADFPAAILIVKHMQPTKSLLPVLLQRVCKLPVIESVDGQLLKLNHIYVAPPNFHMTVSKDKIFLNNGPKVNHSRPAIDPLFYSAALNNGPNTIGIILSGMLDDGSAGALAIKRCGGILIVQDLGEAEYPDMPKNALNCVDVDYCLPSEQIASVLINIVGKVLMPTKIKNKILNIEAEMNLDAKYSLSKLEKIATPTAYSCPACKGVLWKINDSFLDRYRCHVGHGYGLKSLEASYSMESEAALWTALRILEEKKLLISHLVKKIKHEHTDYKNYLIKKLNKIGKQMKTIRSLIKSSGADY